MKNHLVIMSLLLASYSSFQLSAMAEPGVVIDVKGRVTIDGALKAKAGTQFGDGATIEVAGGGSATIMFANGAIRKLSSGEKFTAVRSGQGGPSGNQIIRGIAMAYNDATSKNRGPVVHGMVKAAPGQASINSGDQKLNSIMAKQMRSDLAQIDSLGLSPEGKTLMRSQVYYKYGQYKKMVSALLPLYKKQSPPSDMVKSLLALGYENLGNQEEAAKYK